MRSLIITATFVFSTLTHAAIIEADRRLSADEFAQQQAGCTLRSPEMRLAKACYTGDMDVNSKVKFIGTVGDDDKARYCYNALVLPTKTGVRSQMQVLRDNESGQLRAQNFDVLPGPTASGKSMVVSGIEGHCVTAAKIDGPSCSGTPTLAIGYSGTPGSDVSVDSLGLGAKGAKATSENGNQDLTEISRTLVTDIDQRLDAAADALKRETESAKNRGAVTDVMKRKAKAVGDCATAVNAYRASHKLITPDAEADQRRRQIVDVIKRIEAGQPPSAPGAAGATSGSSR